MDGPGDTHSKVEGSGPYLGVKNLVIAARARKPADFRRRAAAVLLTAGCAGVTPEPETPVSQPSPADAGGRDASTVAPPPARRRLPPRPQRQRRNPHLPRHPHRAFAAAPPALQQNAMRGAAAARPRQLRPPASAAPLTLDLAAQERLSTKAIGVFTKLSLKNKVDDLLDHFREHYQGKPTPTMAELRQSYDLMMMKVLSLLQDDDQPLAASIVSSREAIWGLLSDPDKFAALQS